MSVAGDSQGGDGRSWEAVWLLCLGVVRTRQQDERRDVMLEGGEKRVVGASWSCCKLLKLELELELALELTRAAAAPGTAPCSGRCISAGRGGATGHPALPAL